MTSAQAGALEPAPGSSSVPTQPGPQPGPEHAFLTPVPDVARTEAGWRACVELPLDPRAAGAARRTTRQVLQGWGLQDEDLLHDVAVVVSELVGNGVRHGGGRCGLEVLMDETTVEVAVIDGSAVLPQPRGFEDDAEGGRGIAIVGAISREWGVQEQPDGGKRVFARLAR